MFCLSNFYSNFEMVYNITQFQENQKQPLTFSHFSSKISNKTKFCSKNRTKECSTLFKKIIFLKKFGKFESIKNFCKNF